MVAMAVALVGSTSIPLLWTRKPKNFPEDTPNAHRSALISFLTYLLCHPHSPLTPDASYHEIWPSSLVDRLHLRFLTLKASQYSKNCPWVF